MILYVANLSTWGVVTVSRRAPQEARGVWPGTNAITLIDIHTDAPRDRVAPVDRPDHGGRRHESFTVGGHERQTAVQNYHNLLERFPKSINAFLDRVHSSVIVLYAHPFRYILMEHHWAVRCLCRGFVKSRDAHVANVDV